MEIEVTQLYQIANQAGTDKGHVGPSSSWSANNYTDIYQAYFGLNRLKIKSLCEIGLGVPGTYWNSSIAHGRNPRGGGSARMWLDFFQNAKIYGLDINPATHLDNDRLKTFIVDQSSKESLSSFISKVGDLKFDIIVDDGSHIADHQQLTISLMWNLLEPGGYYVIEDLNDVMPGDRKRLKHAPILAEPTLFLFERFMRTGKMGPRNTFCDQVFLETVDYMAFHAFPTTQRLSDFPIEIVRTLMGRGKRGLSRHEFNTDSPKILVLHKKPNAI